MARWPFAGRRLYSLSGPRFHLHVLLWEVTVNKTLLVLSVGLLARASIGPAERLLNMVGEQRLCALVYAGAFTANLVLCSSGFVLLSVF